MPRRRDWLWLLAINIVANLVVDATLNEHVANDPWITILVHAWPGFVVSTTISSMCMFVLAYVAPIVFERFGAVMRWIILIPLLVVLAIAGNAIAVVFLTLMGYVRDWNGFVSAFNGSVRIAIAMTLLFGIYSTITGALRAQLDETTLALRTKERDEAEARRMASEAQLASLESRVNPHFFFNTLNSIAALTREDAARAERMTTQLASLMRSSLDQSSTPLVALETEVQSVRDYLEIEQVRFGDRLRYGIQVASEARAVPVPRLALQTVVENSVKYAVTARREGASVTITGQRADGRLRVEVTDDGPGFNASAVPDGHGLALIRARLAMLYGDRASLTISSRPGRTIVAMDIPVSDDNA